MRGQSYSISLKWNRLKRNFLNNDICIHFLQDCHFIWKCFKNCQIFEAYVFKKMGVNWKFILLSPLFSYILLKQCTNRITRRPSQHFRLVKMTKKRPNPSLFPLTCLLSMIIKTLLISVKEFLAIKSTKAVINLDSMLPIRLKKSKAPFIKKGKLSKRGTKNVRTKKKLI